MKFAEDTFKIPYWDKDVQEQKYKLLKDMDNWTLLNLPSATILGLPDKLANEYGISTHFLEGALKEFHIQTIGRGPLEDDHMREHPTQYLLAKTRHYSWPKGLGTLFPQYT